MIHALLKMSGCQITKYTIQNKKDGDVIIMLLTSELIL